MPTEVTTLASLASEAYACFETARRSEICPTCGGIGQHATARSAKGSELERHERSGTPCRDCNGTSKRQTGESFDRVRDGSPEWLADLTWTAHDNGEMLPDDWRYKAIVAALDYLSDDDGTPSDEQGHEFADGHVDAYNGARLAWLASHGLRPRYVDQAHEDGLAGENADLLEQIGAGQYVESLEVFEQVRGFLQDRLDTLDNAEGV